MFTALNSSAQSSPERASYGARRSPYRADYDFYPTPPEAVRALLRVESFDGSIWEPACGDGAIAKELERHGHQVHSTDLIDRGYGEGGNDFLSPITVARIAIENPQLKHIITNPPYSYLLGIADKFVGQALKFSRPHGGKVAMLLNLGSLAHQTRTAKWRNDPPAKVHIMDQLICWPNGNRRNVGRYITEHRYCWVVWSPDRCGATQLTWLRMAEFT